VIFDLTSSSWLWTFFGFLRLINSNDQETVRNIVRFNNTQNEITTWDPYSNSDDQQRLQDEFKSLGHNYSLKRGFGESLSGIGIEVVAQLLLAFAGDFQEANRGKNGVFERSPISDWLDHFHSWCSPAL